MSEGRTQMDRTKEDQAPQVEIEETDELYQEALAVMTSTSTMAKRKGGE